jgi:hypothetical protein
LLTSHCAVPSTAITFGAGTVALPSGAPDAIDIRTMGLKGVSSSHVISIVAVDDGNKTLPLTGWPAPAVITASLPEALWGQPLDDTARPSPDAKLVPGLATGLRFAPPGAKVGATIGPLDPEAMLTPLGGGHMPLIPASQADPIAAPVVDAGTIAAIRTTVGTAAASKARSDLVKARRVFQVECVPVLQQPLHPRVLLIVELTGQDLDRRPKRPENLDLARWHLRQIEHECVVQWNGIPSRPRINWRCSSRISELHRGGYLDEDRLSLAHDMPGSGFSTRRLGGCAWQRPGRVFVGRSSWTFSAAVAGAARRISGVDLNKAAFSHQPARHMPRIIEAEARIGTA